MTDTDFVEGAASPHREPVLAPSTSTDAEREAYSAKAKSLPITGEFEPLIDPSVLPALPVPAEPREGAPFTSRPPEEAAKWEALIADYEREAKATGAEPRTARLWLEIGRIYEEELAKPRSAATSYQRAFNLDPKNPAILHASRRLFTEVGNWAMVVQILGYEIESAETPERRATLHAERGVILEEKLRSGDEAQRAFRDALEAWSAEPLAVNALERMYQFRREYDHLYTVYQRALEASKKPERRLPLLIASAHLAEDRLEQPANAIGHYLELLELDPKNATALEALRRLTLSTKRYDEYVRVLGISAELADSPQEAAQMLLAAARVQHERLDQTDKAVLTLLRALEYAPEDLVVLREIELLYEQNDRYDEVVKVLRREAEVTTEARDRVPILFKLGTLLEDRMGSSEEAAQVLEEAVGLMPSYVPAKQSLGRLYGKMERWQSLADLFEMEIRLEDDVSGKVTKLFKLAGLREVRLDQVDAAVETLKEILTLEPDYQPARKALERLFTARGAWAELIKLHEEELGLTEDRDQRIFLLGRIGLLAEDKIGDLKTAARAYERMLELAPGHLQAIRTLARIATSEEAWAEVLRLHELEIEATEDQKEVVAILHRAGTVSEERLNDVAGAVERYEKALRLNPTYLPALRSLGRLYHQGERWQDLLSMFEKELEVSKSTEQTVALLFRIAGVRVERLHDDEGAVAAYERILEQDAKNLPALRALAELHAKRNENEALVEVLLREAETVTDPKERATTLMRVAEISEERLDRADRAAEMYQEVLRLGHHFDSATRALVRIYSAEGLWNALSRALRTAHDRADDDITKAAILVRSAEVAGEHLGNLDGAAENLEQALVLRPGDVTILGQLERISVARRDWRRAIAVAKELAQHESDPRLYAARQIRIAIMKETQIDPPESGAEHYRLALETVPDHPVALRALEMAYLRAGQWEGLAVFYHREALVSRGEDSRVGFYTRAGSVAEHRVQNDAMAAEMYDRALEIDPRHLPALKGRRRVAERRAEPAVALECVRIEGEITADPAHARELLFEAARIYQDQFGEHDKAVETYESVLARAPDHLGAFNRLEAIYLEREAWGPMLTLLEHRAAAVKDVDEQAKLYLAAGQIAQDRLSDPPGAIRLYRAVLERNKMHPTALVRLGPLHFAAQEWDAAVEVFHRTLAVSKEPQVLQTSFTSLGIIYQEHRQDLVKCVQSFQAALQAEPTNTDVLRRLAMVYREAQDWTSAVNVLLRLAEVEKDLRRKIETLLELGRLYEVELKDPKSAILANRKVLEIDPSNSPAITRLTELYEQQQDWQSLADSTAAYVRLLPPDQKGKAAPLHLKMADIFEHRIRDDARAITSLKHALESQPDNAGALERLSRLYGKAPDSYPQAVEAHRRLLRLDPFRVESLHEMRRMFERRSEHDKAFVICEILVFLRAQHQDEDLYYHEHKAKVAAHAANSLTAADHERMITHPAERGPIRAIFEHLSTELSKVFPGDLSKYELNKSTDRYGPKANIPIRALSDELAGVLGTPTFDLWITKRFDLGLFVENERPPALIVGANVGRRIQDKDQRFLLARQLERIKGGHHLMDLLPSKDVEVMLWTIAKMANPAGSVPIDSAALDAMQRQLAKAVPTKTRRALEEAGAKLFNVHVDVNRHRAVAGHTANRAGLAMSNDIEVAVRNIAKDHPDVRPVFTDAAGAAETIGKIPEVRELLSYAVSEEYFSARARLGFSIQS